ncbi:DUF1905 domain-containing protein [Microbacterium sp. cx-59]|uniref:DUF1905 domain-containing protein n=1 Tax=Microbacterium sp. cx-59 TaxID=2891207 RepID=UPI001E30EFBA|nr:DUF1905 domain-containing protein [Microbacterium sp. cx-59]MCC4907644.1 DUF1905 domain-containing protein [Microbacterium sp. cx-59]
MHFVFDAELYRWAARADSSWYFVAVPREFSDEIRQIPRVPRGFGAVRVEAEVAGLTWRTSIFPGEADGAYSLPIKRAVRERAAAGEGDAIRVALTVLDG